MILPTQRNYFHGGPFDGRVLLDVFDRTVVVEGGRYEREVATRTVEPIPGVHLVNGDAFYRFTADPAA